MSLDFLKVWTRERLLRMSYEEAKKLARSYHKDMSIQLVTAKQNLPEVRKKADYQSRIIAEMMARFYPDDLQREIDQTLALLEPLVTTMDTDFRDIMMNVLIPNDTVFGVAYTDNPVLWARMQELLKGSAALQRLTV